MNINKQGNTGKEEVREGRMERKRLVEFYVEGRRKMGSGGERGKEGGGLRIKGGEGSGFKVSVVQWASR